MTRDPAQTSTPANDADDARAGAHSTTDIALQRAERAFSVGDYRALRRLLPSLQAEPTRTRAGQLARAIAVDPAQFAVLALCALALAAIAIRYGAS